MSQKVNRNLSPQRNFSINITFENILHKEVHYATSLKSLTEKTDGRGTCRNFLSKHRVGGFLVVHSRKATSSTQTLQSSYPGCLWLRRPVWITQVQIRPYLKRKAISFCSPSTTQIMKCNAREGRDE